MHIAATIIFALAVTADGFIAGLAYGIKKIRIPFFSLLVIVAASALAVSISMLLGQGIAVILPAGSAQKAGALFLMVLGGFFLLKAIGGIIEDLPSAEEEPLITLKLKSLGIVIQVLKRPVAADFDSSGELSNKEALLLGLVLAIDAMGAGIGIAMAGYNILFTAFAVGMLKFILVNGGVAIGKRMKNESLRSIVSFVPGLSFIIIGIIEFL